MSVRTACVVAPNNELIQECDEVIDKSARETLGAVLRMLATQAHVAGAERIRPPRCPRCGGT